MTAFAPVRHQGMCRGSTLTPAYFILELLHLAGVFLHQRTQVGFLPVAVHVEETEHHAVLADFLLLGALVDEDHDDLDGLVGLDHAHARLHNVSVQVRRLQLEALRQRRLRSCTRSCSLCGSSSSRGTRCGPCTGRPGTGLKSQATALSYPFFLLLIVFLFLLSSLFKLSKNHEQTTVGIYKYSRADCPLSSQTRAST
jgi:hypothetical protein